jgi:hypothetical protein
MTVFGLVVDGQEYVVALQLGADHTSIGLPDWGTVLFVVLSFGNGM